MVVSEGSEGSEGLEESQESEATSVNWCDNSRCGGHGAGVIIPGVEGTVNWCDNSRSGGHCEL
eukprot:3818137-Rhodomonas_salina.1